MLFLLYFLVFLQKVSHFSVRNMKTLQLSSRKVCKRFFILKDSVLACEKQLAWRIFRLAYFFFWEKLREFTESIDNLFVTLFFILSVLIRQFAKWSMEFSTRLFAFVYEVDRLFFRDKSFIELLSLSTVFFPLCLTKLFLFSGFWIFP